MRRRGFATATAVTLLAVLGVTLAAMGTYVAADARRTRSAATDAQLRQLLLAGAAAAQDRIASATDENWSMPLPATLQAAELSILTRADGIDARAVTIVAKAEGRESLQMLRYHKRNQVWRMTESELQP